MALLTLLPEHSELPQPQKQQPPPPKRKKREMQTHAQKPQKQTQKQQKKKKPQKPASSWDHFKNLLTCKQVEVPTVHDPSKNSQSGLHTYPSSSSSSSSKLITSSCGSICSFRDVALGNTRVVHRADNSPEPGHPSHDSETRLLTRKSGQHGSSSSRSLTSGSTRSNGRESYTSSSSTTSFRGMQFRRLSGCYECHMIVDPSRYPISPRVCACSQCGEVFPKLENLEIHQAVRHAVSELGPEDSGRNIVEIIFKSSWLKKDSPICKIERILKVHSTQRTIQRFEDCRDAVKARALQTQRKDARCAADGNELLRFHCTTLTCPLGACGSSALCSAIPGCGVCTLIRHGFGRGGASTITKFGGVRATAISSPASITGNVNGLTTSSNSGKTSMSGGGTAVIGGIMTTASSGRAHDSLQDMGSEQRAMLVCRVIAGSVKRAAAEEVTEDENEVLSDGGAYDSLAVNAGVYSNLEELLVFNPRAILPCFVVIYKVLES